MLDRRAFLAAGAACLALGGAGAQPGALAPVATRRSIRRMASNDPDLVALRRAVAAMKALPRSDPRNWYRFADIHAEYCPHGNWYFLPWHRAYLVAFERICRQLSGKADFALPYWDWSLDRLMPVALAAGRGNPLLHPRALSARGARLPDDMVGLAVLSRIMASPDFEAFGNTRPFGQDGTDPRWQHRAGAKTELEFNPHDGVHQAVGGDMARTTLAARDPVFFLHHANIDRLWAEWNRRGNANSPEPMWREFVFDDNFFWPDGTVWDVAVGELGSPDALGYRYDDDGPFAADVALPVGDPATERLRAFRRHGSDLLACMRGGQGEIPLASGDAIRMARAENGRVASRGRPIAISVPLRGDMGRVIGTGAPAYGSARPDRRRDRRFVFAVICDMADPRDASTRVRVFCDSGNLSARARSGDPGYVTSISFFPHGRAGAGHSRHGGGGGSYCVDLTHALAGGGGLRDGRLTLQLLPECANASPGAADVRPGGLEIVVI